ncbi:restriction endonuclease subunit S [Acinetobacter calcoaceticus]
MSVPKLRFKEFNGAVTKNFIKDIAKTYVGRDLVEEAYSPIKTETHIYPIYSNSVDNEGLYGYYNFQEFNFDNDALTVVGRGAGLGRAFYRQGGFGTIGRLLCLIPKNKSFHPKYLSDYINDRLIIHNESGGIPQLPRSSLENYEVILPSYEEQTKIASFLSAVDEKISLLTKKHELLWQYKQGMMQKLFSQEIRFKADDGSEFEEWEKVRLGNYLVKHDEKTEFNNQYPVLTSSRNGIFFQKDYFSGQDIASADTTGYNVVPYGYFTYRHMSDDLIFKFNINTLCPKGIVSTLYPVFTVKPDFLNTYFLQTILNEGQEFKNFAIMQKQGGSRTYMYFSKLVELFLTIPCLDEQTKIANFLSAIDQKIEVVAQQIEQAKEWKKGLLQQMFV